MRPTITKIAVLLTALSLVIAACGDDDNPLLGSGDTPDTTATDDTTGDTVLPDEPDADTSAAAPATTAGDATPPGGASPEIQDLLDRFADTPLRTVYRFDEPPNDQIITLSQDPGREQSATLIGPDGSDGKIITTGDATIFCSPAGDVAQCFEVPEGAGFDAAGGLFSPLIAGFLITEGITNTPGFTVDQDGATVAGRSGLCFTYTPRAFVEADIEFVRQCIDAELGFTLLIEGRDTGSDTVETFMELLEFGQPRPGDFEPTGPIMEMPGS